jgi:putative membrane protein
MATREGGEGNVMTDEGHVTDDDPGAQPSSGPRGPALRDSAPRRTYLAAERTYLAWLRTGLGALGLALAVGRLIPALIESEHVAFAMLGTGYGAVGVFLILFSGWRQRRVHRALVDDAPIPTDTWVVNVLTIAGLALAAFTIVLVLAAV